MKKNNNIVKTLVLLVFVLLEQTCLMAQESYKIWYKKNNHIHIVKEKGEIKVSLIDSKGESENVKEIYVKPGSDIKFHYEVKNENGYKFKFPVNRSETSWPGNNSVSKIEDENVFLYNLTNSTQNLDDKVIKSTVNIEKDSVVKKLILKNADDADILLTINVLEPVVFEGLKWCVDSVKDKLVYSSEPKSISLKNINKRIKLEVKEAEFLKGKIIKLAAFSIINNTSDSILSWEMSPNLFTEKTGLSVYSAIDTSLLSNYQDNIEGSEKEYFIGINKDKLDSINSHGPIPYTFKTIYGSIKGEEIPELHIKESEKYGEFVAFFKNNWILISVVLIIAIIVFFLYRRILGLKKPEEPKDPVGDDNVITTSPTEASGTLGRQKNEETEGDKSLRHISKTDKTEINNEEPKQKPTNIPAQSDEDKNENVLRALGLLISKKIKAEGGDLGTVLVKLVNENQPLPDNLKDKKTLLDYINNKNESQLDELDKFLKTFEEIKRKYNLNSLSELISSMEDLDILNKQFDRLKSYGNKRNLTFNQNDFASNYEKEFVELDEQLKELKSILKTKDAENKKKIDNLEKENENTIKARESIYRSSLQEVSDSLNRYKGELKLRGLDYISGLQFCAEELEKIYIGIRSSAHQSSDIVITEFVAPILKGDHSIRNSKEGGLSGFINKLNDRDLLMQLMGVNSWEELKEGDPETKRLFVKNLVEGSDFLTIIDSVSALYAYSRVRFKDGSIDIDVSRDFSKRGIDYDEIAIAYGILRSTLKSLFSIDIITCELFKEKLDESIHEKGNVRRFKDLGDRYIAIEGQVGPQVIVDIIKVGLKSEKYKIDRKAVVAHK